MEKIYEHNQIETKWYDFWEKKGLFKPNNSKKHFSIILPPPNANGRLHIGHAMYVVEDILVRYHRMLGDSTLWLPGSDHAGILTQVVYERQLEKENKTRHDLGREEFFKRTYEFSQTNKNEMYAQLRAMGFSLDWSREKFTLDPEISKVVYQTFKDLYDDGLIYRGTRMINWCPRCATVLSDLEVIHKDKESNLWFLKYPIKNSKDFVTVATTRPETMLGDVAVAVNPEDKRYSEFVGKTVVLPLMSREIPIITDNFVSMEFGSGMVKITPAHDPNDYEIGTRHNLEQIQVVGLNDKMTDKAGTYSGLDKYAARKQIVADLESKGLLEKNERITNSVGVCERCGTIVEPQVSKQWFVAVNKTGKSGKNLAKDALAAVKKKNIAVIPERFEKIYYNWMENIHDWCISRQLWWGHQIPVWYKQAKQWDLKIYDGDEIFNSLKNGAKRFETRAGKPEGSDKNWQEFKNGDLVNFSLVDERTEKTLSNEIVTKRIVSIHHFPSVEKLLKKFDVKEIHPNNPEDYVKWWESRPKFSDRIKKFGIWAFELEAVAGKDEMYIGTEPPKGSGWVQDPDTLDTWFSSGQWPFTTLGYGQKDDSDFKAFYPTSVMETGYDILFFWVARMIMLGLYVTGEIPFETVYLHGLVRDEKGQKMSKSKDNSIDPLTVAEKYGADAVRMSLVFGTGPGNDANLGETKIKGMRNFTNKLWNIGRYVIDMAPEKTVRGKENKDDQWILAELAKTNTIVTEAIEKYRFSQAAEELYEFIWHKFADKYIESSKDRREESQDTLEIVLEKSLRLLHPFMPFLTEELWQRLPNKKGESIMVSPWPK